ncbi:MAG TPA: TRAM domain-containing protein [Opitutaceae bacterium]|nr:TRAM domain-containing protein [Opitutaceae bacterium]
MGNKPLLIIRVFFLVLCVTGSLLLAYVNPDWQDNQVRSVIVGLLIGTLVILVDISIKGFSLRGLTALTFGIAMGTIVSFLLSVSPLFNTGDPGTLFLARLIMFVVCCYLGAVIALRGKDDFNFVIPYVRFVRQETDVPMIVLDASTLIDGRIAKICETQFVSGGLIIPRFILSELQRVADSTDPVRRARGRRGLETLNALRKITTLDLKIHDSEVSNRQEMDAKLVFIAQSMKAKLLTMDYSLAQMAQFQGVVWLNLNSLARAVRPELTLGETVEVDIVKPGKEEGQGVGYLEDGSMVVIADGRGLIGKRVTAEVVSVLPSAGGKMVFAKASGRPAAPAPAE